MTTPTGERLVVLGASNLTLLMPRLAATAAGRRGAPVEVLAAAGFGRSYGSTSRFLARELPAILDCNLWPALAAAPPVPADGIVMDVGNDVLYGAEPPAILAWIEEAVQRLRPHVRTLAIAGLPPRLERVGALRYGFLRTVLVPGCTVRRIDALQRARDMQHALYDLAAASGARFVPMDPAWYGVDPLHVSLPARGAAAAALLGVGRSETKPASWTDALRVWRGHAEVRSCFGRRRHTPQPAARLQDGSTVSWY